jgi:hypothetical protein
VLAALLLRIQDFGSDAVSSGGWLATFRRILMPSSAETSRPRRGINFNISGFHIVVLFNLSEEKVHIPSNTTK